ncbi:hypothetical protein GQX74_004953 [Glossina fuscipes]|nr:hypothetical protein GQX74_004953 [Glossina fuscipes]
MSSTQSNYEEVVRYSVSLLSDRTPLTSFDTANTADGLANSERLRANHEFPTSSDITSGLKTRNNKKSAGPDEIPNFPGADPKLVNSQRPISLLSNVGKLFEYFLLLNIQQHLTENRILKDFQFGFRRRHSTTYALIAFSNSLIERINARSATIAVSLDIAKTFDTAWQDGIVGRPLQ